MWFAKENAKKKIRENDSYFKKLASKLRISTF